MSKPAPVAPAEFIVRVRTRLAAAFAPGILEIRDETARHAGHREAAGRFHLDIRIVSSRFTGLAPIARHRMINEVLADELAGPLHALSLQVQTPEEAGDPPRVGRLPES